MSNSRPDIVGTHQGAYAVSQTTSWAALTSASFKDLRSAVATPAALPASLTFTNATVVNTHATQSLYIRLASLAAGDDATPSITIGPGASYDVPMYGPGVTAISVRGSGAATTGVIHAYFVAR